MSYLTFAQLTEDVDFGRRSRSCVTEQANYWINDTRGDMKALSEALLLQEGPQTLVMLQGICAGPGFATTVDDGKGGIDSSLITDADMLSQCQAIYPTVAALFYNPDGSPKP